MDIDKIVVLTIGLVAIVFVLSTSQCQIRKNEMDAHVTRARLEKGINPMTDICERAVNRWRNMTDVIICMEYMRKEREK